MVEVGVVVGVEVVVGVGVEVGVVVGVEVGVTILGYVIIEYNQASGWPSLWSGDVLYDTEAEAQEFSEEAERENRGCSRRETYRVARVELVGED